MSREEYIGGAADYSIKSDAEVADYMRKRKDGICLRAGCNSPSLLWGVCEEHGRPLTDWYVRMREEEMKKDIAYLRRITQCF